MKTIIVALAFVLCALVHGQQVNTQPCTLLLQDQTTGLFLTPGPTGLIGPYSADTQPRFFVRGEVGASWAIYACVGPAQYGWGSIGSYLIDIDGSTAVLFASGTLPAYSPSLCPSGPNVPCFTAVWTPSFQLAAGDNWNVSFQLITTTNFYPGPATSLAYSFF